MRMKAISLWQPWASLMMTPAKRNETRSWYTSHRGPLVICAAKRPYRRDLKELVEYYSDETGFQKALLDSGLSFNHLPLGCALGIVDVIEVVKTDDYICPRPELFFGNYSFGRFAWTTRLIKIFDKPLPIIGRQGFFEVEIPDGENMKGGA